MPFGLDCRNRAVTPSRARFRASDASHTAAITSESTRLLKKPYLQAQRLQRQELQR